MANLKIDSPVSRRIVHAFLDFLNSVEPTPGTDLEGLMVVRDCLEDVFKLNSSSSDVKMQPGLLVNYFSSLGLNNQPEPISGNATNLSAAPSTSVKQEADESLSQIPKAQNEGFAGEPHISGLSKDELFGHFCSGLDKIHFFSTRADEHWQLDKVTRLFHEAVTELEKSGSQAIDTPNLAEMFKSQGNRAMQSKLYSDAIELYTYAIALCQNNSVYYCNRAAAFTQINKYIEAIGDCKKSIEIDPNYSKAYSRLGLVYYAQGNYRDALEKGFLKALQLDPDNESVKENIRMAEQKLRDAHRAGQHQNGRSMNHSNQEPTNGQASGGPRNWNVPGMSFNLADFPPGVSNVFMNMVGQTPQERTNDGSETGRSDNEPEIRIGGNVNFNIGEDMPEEFLGTWRSMMGMFSGAQPHQNPEGDMNRGPSPS